MKSLSQILNEETEKYSIDKVYHKIELLKNSKEYKKLPRIHFPIKVAIDKDRLDKFGKNIVKTFNIEYELRKVEGSGMAYGRYRDFYIFKVKNIDEWLLVCGILNECWVCSYSEWFEGQPNSEPDRLTEFYIKRTQELLREV